MGHHWRYVLLPEDPCLADLDHALRQLRARRMATGYAIVRAWVDAEIDAVLDIRLGLGVSAPA